MFSESDRSGSDQFRTVKIKNLEIDQFIPN